MKKYIVLTVIVISFTLGVAAVLWMQKPSQGSVITTASSGQNTASQVSAPKQLEGEHFSLQYSGKYVTSGNTPSNNDIERYTLSAGTNYDKRILAAVVNLPGGKLESNGDYIFRMKSPTLYSKRQLKTTAGTFDIWVKSDGSEQSAMVARGDKAMVLTFVTVPSADSELPNEVTKVLNSVVWKN